LQSCARPKFVFADNSGQNNRKVNSKAMLPRRYAVLLVCLINASVFAAATRPHYVHFADSDWGSLIGPPPLAGSPEQKGEIVLLLDLQSKRTPAQVKRCKAEASATAFYFSRVLGEHFDEHDLPVTTQLLHDAYADAQSISEHIKRDWHRARPYDADSRINPCVTLEKSPSYPSGHAIRGILWATILSDIFPEKKDALMSLGRQLGDDRLIAGVHYPSDVVAGQKLGAAIAQKLLANPDFRAALAKARAECLAPVH
jgi:acid phosphatase (class A)